MSHCCNKPEKDQFLTGQEDGENPVHSKVGIWPTETLLCLQFCVTVLYNSSDASSGFNLYYVTLISMTLGQKLELQYLNTPWPFTCKLKSDPLAETNYCQLLVAGHEWAS